MDTFFFTCWNQRFEISIIHGSKNDQNWLKQLLQFLVDDLDLESFGEKKKKKKKKKPLDMEDLEEALPDDKAEVC